MCWKWSRPASRENVARLRALLQTVHTEINRKMVYAIWFLIDLIRFRKYLSVCTAVSWLYPSAELSIHFTRELIELGFPWEPDFAQPLKNRNREGWSPDCALTTGSLSFGWGLSLETSYWELRELNLYNRVFRHGKPKLVLCSKQTMRFAETDHVICFCQSHGLLTRNYKFSFSMSKHLILLPTLCSVEASENRTMFS